MRALFLTVALLFSATGTFASGIRAYDVGVAIHDDGTAGGRAALRLEDVKAGRVTIPLGFAPVSQLRLVSAPARTAITSEERNGQTIVALELPSEAPGETAVAFTFQIGNALVSPAPVAGQKSTVPANNRIVAHALVNTEPTAIGAYQAEFIFPAGMRAHAIREALPKLSKSETEPRVRLVEIGERNGARLRTGRLLQGDKTSMQVEILPRKRSPWWLVAGVALSILYLIHFRDLVAKKPQSAAKDQTTTGVNS